MDPVTLGTIISAGAGLAGAAASGISSGKMNKKSVKYNKWALQEQQRFQSEQSQLGRDWSEEMMSKANQWNLDQWNRENEYNLPENQKAFGQKEKVPAICRYLFCNNVCLKLSEVFC